MDSDPDSLSSWTLWQLIDSAFPVGSFAHSGGLEAAVQLGEITGADDVLRFVRASIQQAASLQAPFVIRSVNAANDWIGLDRLFDAMLRNGVGNKASRQQGQALIATAGEVWPSDVILRARTGLKAGTWFGHLPIAFGLTAGVVGISEKEAADAFLFCQMRGILSAAVRLGVAGSREAQRLQAKLADDRPEWIRIAMATDIENATQTAPLIELLQAQQDRLYSRLFVS